MGIGFIFTIVLLAVVVGLFSKQALSAEKSSNISSKTSSDAVDGQTEVTELQRSDVKQPPHAM